MKKITASDVLYEDNHLLIINKQAGILVQGDATGDMPLADHCKAYIKEKYHKPGEVYLGVIHRLDRPVSGVVAFAKTSKALERMNALFRDRHTKKTYWAVVSKKPSLEAAKLVHWLIKDEKANKTTAYDHEVKGSLKAELNYQILGKVGNLWLLEVHPITGRPHQIRVQLASMGCVIKGDVKYGDKTPNANGSIYLHARSLEFTHPVKQVKIKAIAPPPDDVLWNSTVNFE